MTKRLLLPIGVALTSFLMIAADDNSLRFDPFKTPARSSASGDASETWQPVLKATLASSGDPIANLGGVLLRVGEKTHGYELLKVSEGEATFDKDGRSVVLTVKQP